MVVDAQGIPLTVVITAANVTDSTVFEAVLESLAPIHQRRGRPRRWPAKMHGDRGYDARHCRAFLAQHHIACRLARKHVESGTRLGRHRWVIERTMAWLNRFRRLAVRYERRLDIHQAFVSLACALICWRYLQKTFC